MIKICLVAGARPNFIKIKSIIDSIDNNTSLNLTYKLVHTGQHYDDKMSSIFFSDLNLPDPDINLNCTGKSNSEQIADIMVKFDNYLKNQVFDCVLVVGDVNSTIACSLVAKLNNILVAHVEAGLRSYDNNMPEEINRIATDSITDYFFTTTESSKQILLNSGIDSKKIFFVGNTMIDTLKKNINKLKKPSVFNDFNLKEKSYYVMTMHRPANVNNLNILINQIKEICNIINDFKIIYPVHPRVNKKNINKISNQLVLINPLGYLEFNYLVKNSKGVFTDSGGISEETSYLNIPCYTLRDNTERPETIDFGTNILLGTNPDKFSFIIKNNLKKTNSIKKIWDGMAGNRIVTILSKELS